MSECQHTFVCFARDYDDPHYYCGGCGERLEALDPIKTISEEEFKAGGYKTRDWFTSEEAMKKVKEGLFETKDSGARQEFESGMVRDIQEDKARYDLLDMPMLTRWAELMARGAKKYGEHNWKKAFSQQELDRFRSSALRHMMQWINNETDEDHAAAVYFNIAGAEMVKRKLKDISSWDLRQG
jgi:hypothetical protein